MNRTLCWVVLAAGVLASFTAQAQGPYTADWESLDKRPVAPWFEDAKFGIFIHWGPYSVPAWAPKGVYSEWYQHWLENKSVSGNGDLKGPEVYNHHVATYGEDFPYYNFGAMFTAAQFNPDEWAKLFADAGAKYVVITSKHHDGFCLWPNAQANDRGFPWNSGEVGAKRDLLGELSQAMKKTELKFGFYYSLYEWFHPWWQKDKERFVDEHFLPQVKDLVTRYEPDILWGDGEWEMKSSAWKSPEMLAWLFNESPVKDTVVINDRWGKETRQKHGGYYTTEYQQTSYEHPWEECRGMGFSFGYNRNEDAEDYNSPQALVLMLVDIVSNGGNLLLDIGPDGHGDIPVIMQERLLQMGRWLAANGEAIYGTRRWERTVQWSEGNREYKPEGHYVSGEIILKQTVSPEPGYAAKEAFFTRKGDTLYVVSPRWPSDGLRLKGMRAAAGSTVKLLATGEAGTLAQDGADVVLTPPAFDPNRITGELGYAYAFAVSPVPTLD